MTAHDKFCNVHSHSDAGFTADELDALCNCRTLAKVRAHATKPARDLHGPDGTLVPGCVVCFTDWPCPTVQALDSVSEP